MNLSNIDIVMIAVAVAFFAVVWLIRHMIKTAPQIEYKHTEPSNWPPLECERAGKARANEHDWSNAR